MVAVSPSAAFIVSCANPMLMRSMYVAMKSANRNHIRRRVTFRMTSCSETLAPAVAVSIMTSPPGPPSDVVQDRQRGAAEDLLLLVLGDVERLDRGDRTLDRAEQVRVVAPHHHVIHTHQ